MEKQQILKRALDDDNSITTLVFWKPILSSGASKRSDTISRYRITRDIFDVAMTIRADGGSEYYWRNDRMEKDDNKITYDSNVSYENSAKILDSTPSTDSESV